MRALYANGRAAVIHEAECDLAGDALSFSSGDMMAVWPYAELRRADDGNGRIILKRKPDTGERLIFEHEMKDGLRAAAPGLFSKRAMGIERPVVIASLAGVAFAVAAAFLIGVPMASGPIADAMPVPYREQIADISWSQVNALTDYCDDSDEASRILNDMAHRMMRAADVPQRDDIWITIVEAPIPNAFALPDDSIIVTAQLIDLAERPDELAGVLAHEIAHIERNHVLKNIVGSIGAGIFFDVVFGGAGVGQAVAIASVNLAGLRYSREFEHEGDARGLDYLDAAGIDTGGLARMFDHLREEVEGEAGEGIPSILSTHPETTARGADARARSRPELPQPLTDAEWAVVRGVCGRAAPTPPAPAPDPDHPAAAPATPATKPDDAPAEAPKP